MYELTARDRERVKRLHEEYRALWEDPDGCRPLIHVGAPVPQKLAAVCEQVENPALMLEASTARAAAHLAMEDDALPITRVEFGTAQIAAAFGCPLHVFTDSPVACGAHALHSLQECFTAPVPPLTAGWYPKLEAFTRYYHEHQPKGYLLQLPDIQSPFNSAHLIRGNDILTDFYDDPAAVQALCGKVADFLLQLVPWLLKLHPPETEGWFYDWSGLWKGNARLSNCSLHMISPAFYADYVMQSDRRVLAGLHTGRMHYCGTQSGVIDMMAALPEVTGMDIDGAHHDPWEACARFPKDKPLLVALGKPDQLPRLLKGDWPGKRNLIVHVGARSIAEGRELAEKLRQASLS